MKNHSNNPYVRKMEQAALAYLSVAEENLAAIAKLEAENKAGQHGAATFTDKLNTLRQQGADLKGRYIAELAAIQGRYADAVTAWGRVRGEDLTPDAAILTSGIKITLEELADLADRYKDNYTMTRALLDYAQANRESLTGWQTINFPPTAEQKIEAMQNIYDFFELVRPDSYQAMFFQDEAAYAERNRELLAIIGTGSELAG